ncbi:MAG: FixH family protein [Chloroflexi bacterium]|nr:FixH family protein [Chloroflexota bacterium]
MFTRSRILLGMALLLSLILVPSVFAGGWAVVTLDELPVNATAGEPLTVGFTVRQHGKTPLGGLSPTVTFTLPKEEQFAVTAEEDGDEGHYSATVTFPKEGEWEWSIEAFTMNQPMPTISVAASSLAPSTAKSEPVPYMLILRTLAFGLGLIGLFIALRKKTRIAIAFTAICLAVGLASFIPVSTVPKVEAQTNLSSQPAGESSISQVELGRRLFIAKGCITCHVNSKVGSADYWTIEMGAPNLTSFTASPEYLRMWLADPKSVKRLTEMPNLKLSETEIEALIAFISSK